MDTPIWKIAAITLVTLTALWDLLLDWLSVLGENNPFPKSVKDVYDRESYRKWRAYHRENNVMDSVFGGMAG